jgi:hypothetical protein
MAVRVSGGPAFPGADALLDAEDHAIRQVLPVARGITRLLGREHLRPWSDVRRRGRRGDSRRGIERRRVAAGLFDLRVRQDEGQATGELRHGDLAVAVGVDFNRCTPWTAQLGSLQVRKQLVRQGPRCGKPVRERRVDTNLAGRVLRVGGSYFPAQGDGSEEVEGAPALMDVPAQLLGQVVRSALLPAATARIAFRAARLAWLVGEAGSGVSVNAALPVSYVRDFLLPKAYTQCAENHSVSVRVRSDG